MTRRRGGGGRPGGNQSGGGRGQRGGRGGGGPISGPIGRAAGQSFRTPKGRSGGTGGGPRGGGRNTNGSRNGDTPSQRRRGNDQSNAKPNDTKSTTKDPIDVVTGEVLLSQTDVDLPGVLPLLLERTHISTYGAGHLFGRTWASTLDQHLELDSEGVYFLTEDARVLKFPQALLPNVQFRPVAGPQWPLVLTSDGGYTLTDPQLGRTLHFPAPGEEHGWTRLPLTAISDRNGNRIDFHYEDQVLVEVRHSGGYRIAVDSAPLDAESSRTERRVTALRLLVPDADDITLIRFGYDAEGNLAEVVNSSGRPLCFTYDDEGRLTGWIDRNDFWYRYEYDEEGRAVRGIGKDGYLNATLAYDPDNRTTRVTDSLGHTTVYEYNELFQVVAETDPLGNTTRSEWDRHDRLLSRTDPLGRAIRYGYDDQGSLIRLVRPDGAAFTILRDGSGLPVEITAPNGARWRRTYDDRGNLVESIDPHGARTRFTYDQRGRPTSVGDPLGNVTRIKTNGAGLPTAVVDPLGGMTRYERNAAGQVVTTIDPAGGSVRQGWTVEGAPAWRIAADGATERWTYDAEGNLVEYTDAAGQVTRSEHGPFETLIAQTTSGGAHLRFAYDTELRLLSATNALGREWTYRYDAAGALVEEQDFNGRRATYVYDAARQLLSRTNGVGQKVSFTLDVLGNIVEKRTEGETTTFSYDAGGHLVQAVSPSAELRFERDVLGRITAETCNGRTLNSGYDAAGNRIRRRTPAGSDSSWSYDAAGNPSGLAIGDQALAFRHDQAGREVQRRIGTGAILAQQWDADHRLLAQTIWGAPSPAPQGDPSAGQARLLQHRAYQYRADGTLLGINDRLTGARRFEVDPSGRVTSVHAHSVVERYAYDITGNITHAQWSSSSGGAPPSAFDGMGDRLYDGTLIRRAGNVRFEYDGQGRVVLRQHQRLSSKALTWRFQWDADDRLVAVRTPDGHTWRYRYDPLGRRIAKIRLAGDGASVAEEVDFTWDGPLLAEQVRRLRSSPDGGLRVEATAWEYEPGTFRPLSQTQRALSSSRQWIDERFYAIVTDQIGTPSELVAPDGSVAQTPRHTLWGGRWEEAGSPTDCPLRFPGQYHDAETGLHYNYQRYYDPMDGRYQSPDPLGLTPQPDPHAYVLNPTGWTDPLGLCPSSDSGNRGQAGHQYARSIIPGGRRDGQKVFAGHGEYRRGAGEVVVPPGTRVAVYAEHGARIHDRVGLGIETGTGRKPVRVYEAGESMPNYTLKAPDGLNIARHSRTVEDATNLSDLLKPRMGTVHWAACQELRR